MGNKTIVVLSSNRAEKHLLVPVVNELKKRDGFDVIFFHIENFSPIDVAKRLLEIKPAITIVPCDREEMLRVAVELFYNRIPMAHFHAGDISQEGSFDDVARHIITLMCDIHFCNGAKAKKRVQVLLRTIGRPANYVYNVGTTAFDDVEIDYSKVPDEPFDLVLYNVPTKKPEKVDKDLDEIEKMLDKKAVWIYPNIDRNYEKIIKGIERIKKDKDIITYVHLPHSQFLGLIEKCDRFIGNSSSLFLEAPFSFNPRC